jgi:hypothetical protein
MSEFVFSAECPNCKQASTQYGYQAAQLSDALKAGSAIDAQCSACGEEWRITVEERADIARAVGVDRRA